MNCSCTTSGLLIRDSRSHLCLFWPSMDRGGAHSEGSGVIKAQLNASQAELVYRVVVSDTTRWCFAQGWDHAGDSPLSLRQFAEETHTEKHGTGHDFLLWFWYELRSDSIIADSGISRYFTSCHPNMFTSVPQSAAVQDSADFGILCQCRFNCPSVTW